MVKEESNQCWYEDFIVECDVPYQMTYEDLRSAIENMKKHAATPDIYRIRTYAEYFQRYVIVA